MLAATGDGKLSQPSTSTTTEGSQPCRQFEISEILLATNNFDESLVIGHGGFGKVYKGKVVSGSTVVVAAIKRLDSMSTQGEEEFWAEVEMLSKLRHCHLVSLFGYCNYEAEKILIYEYMPNGTLEDHLHKLGTHVYWLQRLKICIGAARGLDYLHTGTGVDSGVIHRDVKSSNILLHESWAAKISDFGLSRIAQTNRPSTYVNTLVKGTFGYFDPNYFTTGRLTRKSDVYAFGVVLLEVLCRKRAVDSSLDDELWGLAAWAQDSIKEGKLKQIIDSSIRSEISPKCLKEFVRIAERCLLSNPKQRPTMADIVVGLDSILILQQKIDSSLQASGKTVLGRMLDMFPIPSNGESSGRTIVLPWQLHKKQVHFTNVAAEEYLKVHYGQLRRFSFPELQVATDKFNNKNIIGQGGFGKVYKGWLANGTLVAVKRFQEKRTEDVELKFQTEIEMSSMTVHPNLLQLRGFCMTPTERLLVYPYMVNGSVASCLRDEDRIATQLVVDWPVRQRIALESAHGLAYLHDHEPKIIHHDVKSANILLDKEFEAVLGGFEMAKLMNSKDTDLTTNVVRGRLEYLAPEYASHGIFSEKIDVFSYGVMLLELITGKRAFDLARLADDDFAFGWVKKLLRDKKLEVLVDANLENNCSKDKVEDLIHIALLCTQIEPSMRPKMSEVVKMLEGDIGLTESLEEWLKAENSEQVIIHEDDINPDWNIEDSTYNLSSEQFLSPR